MILPYEVGHRKNSGMVTHGNARPNFGQDPDEVYGPPYVVEKSPSVEPVECSVRKSQSLLTWLSSRSPCPKAPAPTSFRAFPLPCAGTGGRSRRPRRGGRS